ncbi:uncharacterized protein LOC111734195 isoform X1 [Pteropus vampyrus]|uniref:Uncharacterized protein LOC111734195 isoform X1 n=1 Tax=Pteropus vampyrus TaxID=132908 RepID=A0A6P6C4U0_PTEVA|nr:uncharacterized protein LOC111734195 isoform X1 [Pteropus vampyrus]
MERETDRPRDRAAPREKPSEADREMTYVEIPAQRQTDGLWVVGLRDVVHQARSAARRHHRHRQLLHLPDEQEEVSSWLGFARELGVTHQFPTPSAWTFTVSPCARGREAARQAAELFIRRLLHYLKKLISASWAGSQFVKGDCD